MARPLSLRAPPTPRIGPQREPAKSYIRHNHTMAASTKKTTRRSVIHSNFVALSGAGAGFQSAQASISRECDLAHSSSPGSSLSPIQEAAMTLQPHRLEFKSHWLESIFAMVLAMTVATILTITTWAAPRVPESDSAAPIPPIYRSSHPILY
jgi:hypothetical protein